MKKEIFYVIVDESGNYADKKSIYRDRRGNLRYVPSKELTNGCCYFLNEGIAQKHLDVLNSYNTLHKFRITIKK
jgi:hypothetical protein